MKRSEVIFAVVGLSLFGFVASRIGWTALIHQLASASLAIPVLICISFLRLLLQTHAWRIGLEQEGVTTLFGELLGIRLASQSLLWCVLGLGWLAWRSRKVTHDQIPDGALLPCKQS